MSYTATVTQNNVVLPNGNLYQQGDTVELTDEQYGLMSSALRAAVLTNVVFLASSPGPAGTSILHGTTTPPPSNVGNDGDFYLYETDNVLWGPKASGAWPGSGVSLKGSQFLSGSGAPGSGTGANGDFYFDSAAATLYGPKASGSWPGGTVLGGTVRGRFDVTHYGAVGDGSTDDTAAIQAAINAAVTWAQANSFYAEVYFPVPPVWYAINGPLVKAGSTLGCAQLTLPVIPTTADKVTLALVGQTDAAALWHWQQTTRQVSGVLLKSNSSTAFDSSHGEGSILGGPTPQQGYGGTGNTFSNMHVVIDGIQLMGPNATNGIGGFDFRGVASMHVKSAAYLVDAHPVGGPGVVGGSGAGWAFGLSTPNNGNNDICQIDSFTVEGMTYGAILGEHTQADRIASIFCFVGIGIIGSFWSGSGAAHGVTIANGSVEAVTSGGSHLMMMGAGGAKVDVHLDVEDVTVTITDQGTGGQSTGDVWLTGSWTTLVVPGSFSNVTIHNQTQKPGAVTAPGVPGSTTALQNPFERNAMVMVSGGTVTAIAVDGVDTGVTSGWVPVPDGKDITLTYSVAPTWKWWLM